MKKVTLLALSSVAALYATSITVPTGWSLLGAIKGISPSQITCANTVWTYDNSSGNWNLYVTNPPSTVTNNYGFNPISGINIGQGFWVNNTSGSSCILDFNATTPTPYIYYNAFGYRFIDRKSDATYTVSNTLGTNNVVFNNSSTAPLFTFNAYKSDNNDSKAGLLFAGLSDTNQLSSVDAKLRLVTGTTGYNRAQLNVGKFAITGDDTKIANTGINLKPNGISIWVERRDSNTSELIDTPLSKTINTTNMVGKTVDARISVNGSTISYNITGDVNASDTFTPSTFTLASGIRYAEVRARNDDANADTDGKESGSLTTVEFSAMGVLPYLADINATSVTPLAFSSLGTFYILENDDNNEYTKIVKGSSTFTGNDYKLDGTNWIQDEETFSGSVSNSTFTLPTGGVYQFNILSTQKINSVGTTNFNDLYMSQSTTTVVTAPTEYEYDTWDWTNPSYWNGTTQVAITDINTLIAGFTNTTSGNRIGGDGDVMFLNTGGNVVRGAWDGTSYYTNGCTGDCRIYTRTTEVVGSWTTSGNKILIDAPKENLSLEVKSISGGYVIEEGWKDKVGTVWNEVILSGTDATDTVVQTYLSTH